MKWDIIYPTLVDDLNKLKKNLIQIENTSKMQMEKLKKIKQELRQIKECIKWTHK